MQNIHFARIKFLSEEFTEELDYNAVLKELKDTIAKEKNVDEVVEQKMVVDLSADLLKLVIPAKPYEDYLKSISEAQLHPKSKYYFVTEKLWNRFKEDIFSMAKGTKGTVKLEIKDGDDFFDLAKDCVKLESYFLKKLLVFEVS